VTRRGFPERAAARRVKSSGFPGCAAARRIKSTGFPRHAVALLMNLGIFVKITAARLMNFGDFVKIAATCLMNLGDFVKIVAARLMNLSNFVKITAARWVKSTGFPRRAMARLAFRRKIRTFTAAINDYTIIVMEKYKHIRPEDVYVSSEQWLDIAEERHRGIPHPEITTIRLTGNNFFDLFASLIEGGAETNTNTIAAMMGVRPPLLSPAIEAMSGLTAHQWIVRYKHMKACDHLGDDDRSIAALAARLGFRSVSAFSHFFCRLEGCHPRHFAAKRSCRVLR
jgi:AraC-like DNA-binding protein